MGTEKVKYTHNGHDIVIHFRDEPKDTTYGNHSAWFKDGSLSVDLKKIFNNQDVLPDDIQQDLPDELLDATLDDLKRILNHLADNDLWVCQKCGSLFEAGTGEKIKFAGIKCPDCAKEENTCHESKDGKHDWQILNPRSKNNARKDTHYKCENCGQKRTDVATG